MSSACADFQQFLFYLLTIVSRVRNVLAQQFKLVGKLTLIAQNVYVLSTTQVAHMFYCLNSVRFFTKKNCQKQQILGKWHFVFFPTQTIKKGLSDKGGRFRLKT